MNRIFHARIAAVHYLFLLLTTVLTVYGFWVKLFGVGLSCMMLLLVCIERLIHTTYTVTPDGRLLLYFGRFSREQEIRLKDITSVQRAYTLRIGRFSLMHCVLVHHGDNRCVALLPVNEDEFIRLLQQRVAASESEDAAPEEI